jgi:ligand-binding SRPBCC domain-containing protein
MFRDIQIKGPFALWRHTHRFEPDGASACYLEDRVEYALPMGALGAMVAGRFVRRKLDRLFAYRHEVTASALRA